MKRFFLVIIYLLVNIVNAQIFADTYKTGKEDLKVTLLGHSSLLLQYKGDNIYVDPWSQVTDYSKLPKADVILITHEHQDHLDKTAIDKIKTEKTHFIVSEVVKQNLGYGESINNGRKTSHKNVAIQAVPAYNQVNKRPDGEFYHPKGRGNGYVLTFDDLKVYIAGDTENIPEMENLKGKIDIAFLPKNLPYTMTDEMFVDAVKKIGPKVLYPYHYSELDEIKINDALKGEKIELKIRVMRNN